MIINLIVSFIKAIVWDPVFLQLVGMACLYRIECLRGSFFFAHIISFLCFRLSKIG